ncbi:32174_t:CDS:2, partial [Racocetra persica]
TPKVLSAKPRKPSRFLNELTTNNDKEASINDVDNENLMLVDDETELLIAADPEQVEVERIDEIDDVDIEETNEASLINATNAEVSVLSPLPPSVQKRRTAAIRSRRRNSNKRQSNKIVNSSSSKVTIRRELENLFSEKQADWKRRDFVKACIEKNIYLDNNVELNTKRLFTWFDGRKNKIKQMAS